MTRDVPKALGPQRAGGERLPGSAFCPGHACTRVCADERPCWCPGPWPEAGSRVYGQKEPRAPGPRSALPSAGLSVPAGQCRGACSRVRAHTGRGARGVLGLSGPCPSKLILSLGRQGWGWRGQGKAVVGRGVVGRQHGAGLGHGGHCMSSTSRRASSGRAYSLASFGGWPALSGPGQSRSKGLAAVRGLVPSPELAGGQLVSWGRQEGRCPDLCLCGTRRLPDPVLAQGPPLLADPVDVFGFSGFCQWPVCSWSRVAEGKG